MKGEATRIESSWVFRFGGRLQRAVATRWRDWRRKIQIALSSDRYATKEDYIAVHPDVAWWAGHLNHVLFQEAAAGLVAVGKVLDLGCNHGANSILLARLGYDVTGVDLNAKAIEVAQASAKLESSEVCSRLHFVQSRLNSLAFPDNGFEGAFMIDVLEHLYPRDRPAIFAEILRVMKPGARMILVTPYEHAYDGGGYHVDFFDENKLCSVWMDWVYRFFRLPGTGGAMIIPPKGMIG